MKKTLSHLILLSSLLTGAVSCRHDHQDTPVPAATTLTEYRNGDEFIRFEYNTDGTVKKATVSSDLNTNGNVVDYNISYNAAKKITVVETSAGERLVPVYENGNLIRADVFEGNERTGFNNYYFQNGLLKRLTLYWGSGTDYQPYFEFNFEHDNAGNTIEAVAFIASGEPGHMVRMGHVEYHFDAKVNPLYDQKELMALLYQSASKNNITKEDHFDAQLTLEDQYNYTYTYQSNGLPQSAEVKNGLPGQPPVSSQVKYIYK